MKTKNEINEALKTLQGYIGTAQLDCLLQLLRGEEREYFQDKLCDLAALVTRMPKTYEQDGQGIYAVAHLHYFTSGADWYITEKDAETADEPGQHQAFGLADLGYGAELGYISIVELIATGAELDLHFTPKSIGEIMASTTQPA